MTIHSEPIRKKWHGPTALTLIVGLVCACHIVWIWRDQARFPFGDSYGYLTLLLNFLNDCSVHTLGDAWRALGDLGKSGRPPLYLLLTMPLVVLFGRSEDVAASVNILFTVILMLSVYKAACLIKNEEAGLLAAMTVASYPPIIQLTRMYLPHSALPACSALSLWLLLLLITRRSVKVAWLFGASLAFGLLVHPTFLWFWAVPPVVFGIYLLLFQTEPRRPAGLRNVFAWFLAKLRERLFVYGLVPAAVVAVGFGSSWYLTWGLKLLEVRRRVTAHELGEFRGSAVAGGGDVVSSFWWQALTVPAAISNILAWFALVGLVHGITRHRVANWVPVISAVAGCVLFVLFAKAQAWHFAAIFPFFAVLTGVWIADVSSKWLSAGLATSCVLASVVVFSVVTWGVRPWSRPVATALGARLESCRRVGSMAFCPGPAETGGEEQERNALAERVLGLILEDSKCQTNPGCRLMLVNWTAGLRASSLTYCLARDWPRAKLVVASEGVPTWGGFYDLDALLHGDYIIYGESAPNGWIYQKASVAFLKSPPAEFAVAHQIVGSFSFASDEGFRLAKRVRPLTVEEAVATVEALDLPEEYKFKKYMVIPPLYAAAKRWPEALAYYDEGIRNAPEIRSRSRSLLESARRILLVKMGEFYVKEGRIAQGIESLQEVVRLAPESTINRMRLARAYLADGQSGKAAAELKTVIALAPDQARPRQMLARTYQIQGRAAEAIDLFRQALEIDPTFVGAHISLADTYRQGGRYEDAIAELEEAMSLAPDQVRPRRILAGILESLGRTDRAVAICQEILEIDPADDIARRALKRMVGG